MTDIFEKIRYQMDSLPKQQRAICGYILENQMEASMLTIAELASRNDVGPATVIRTVQALGFEKYNQFKAALREAALNQSATSYKVYWGISLQKSDAENNASKLLNMCAELSKKLDNPSFLTQIEIAAERIIQAKKVFVLGLRSSAPSALTLGNGLLNCGLNVIQLSSHADYVFDGISQMTPADILVAVASPPIVKESTQAIRACYKRGVPVVLIVATHQTSILPYATTVINTESGLTPLSLTITMLAVDILVSEVSKRIPNANQHLNNVENFLSEMGISLWDADEVP